MLDDDLLRESAVHQAEALVRMLRGKKEFDFSGPLPPPDRIQEQLADLAIDDPQHQVGVQLLMHHAHAATAPNRLRDALRAEDIDVERAAEAERRAREKIEGGTSQATDLPRAQQALRRAQLRQLFAKKTGSGDLR